MQRLGSTDLARLLELVERLGAVDDVDAFAEVLTDGVRGLVPCDIASYNEVDPASRRALFACDPAEALFDGAQELFAEHLPEHPLVGYYHRTADGSAIKVSDFLSSRQFHATGLYRDVFRLVSTEYLMSVNFEARPSGSMVALALHRQAPDFDERERALLDVLRPHLSSIYRGVEARQLLARAEDLLDGRGQYLVLADTRGVVRQASPAARRRLRRLLGAEAVREPLPEPLRSVVGPRHPGRLPADHIVVHRNGVRLSVRALQRTRTRVTLLLDEQVQLPPAALFELGLTAREADVMILVERGHTNREVAAALGVSPLTVKSHLEHVFAKLGVRTRTAAAARVRALAT